MFTTSKHKALPRRIDFLVIARTQERVDGCRENVDTGAENARVQGLEQSIERAENKSVSDPIQPIE